MDLHDAEVMARNLIWTYNPGITFQWDRAKSRFGYYNYDKKLISLSYILTAIRPESEVRGTVMHEIAHSLTPAGENHGPLWKAQMIEFGLPTTACSATVVDVSRLKGNWYGVCPKGHKSQHFFRKPRNLKKSCGICSPEFNDKYLLRWHIVR